MALKRRKFIKAAASLGAMAMFPQVAIAKKGSKNKQRVVVIGGGFAGATAAKYIKMWASNIEVVMIERHAHFVSCPQSNLVLSGNRTLKQLTRDYQSLISKYGVQVVQAEVIAIDTDKKRVTLHDNATLDYHRLVIAPGIDFIYGDLPALASDKARQTIPHAWKAGSQTALLKRQMVAMKKGGTMIMTIPTAPFRCPPGPYERACQIAFYFKRYNPSAKLLILDANADVISKKALFKSSWQAYYPSLIEYIPNSRIDDIDVATLRVETEFDTFSADVLNVIPEQRAGKVADMADVVNVDNRWCSVDFLTYESTNKKNVHVIGDAVHAALPKSGHIANAQAKVCAAAVVSLLADYALFEQPVFNNTCYSFVDDKKAGYVATVYRYHAQKRAMLPMPGGGVSATSTALDGEYADAWASNIWADILN